MAFTVNPDGSIRAETVEELRQLLALQKGGEARPAKAPKGHQKASGLRAATVRTFAGPAAPGSEAAKYRALYEEMSDQPRQQRLLRVLLTGSSFSDSELREKLHVDSNLALRGMLIGIVRRAKNQNLHNPVAKEMTRTHGGQRRLYRYSATPAFKAAMEGWFSGDVAV